MPLMPADVRNVTFSKPPLGKRGYHEDEVDAFFDLVQAELARLIEKNKDLRNQVEQFDQQRSAAPVDTGNDLRPVGRVVAVERKRRTVPTRPRWRAGSDRRQRGRPGPASAGVPAWPVVRCGRWRSIGRR
jgi:DivIVA domain-containing protein